MKKSVYILLLIVFSLTSNAQQENNLDRGIYESYAIFKKNGSGNIYYDLQQQTGNSDFSGANLGTFGANCSLVLNGGQAKTYKCNGCNITGSTLFYSIYPATGSPNFSKSIVLNFYSNDLGGCGGNQTWESIGHNDNILAGLSPGAYKIAIYIQTTFDGCGNGSLFASNNGNNYIADFTVLAPPALQASASVCLGSSVTLTGSCINATPKWSTGEEGTMISVSPIINTTYTATCKTAEGCESAMSSSITVTVNSLSVTNHPITQFDCEPNSVRFLANASTSSTGIGSEITYQWQRKLPSESSFTALTNASPTAFSGNLLQVSPTGGTNISGTQFRYIATDGNGCTVTSNPAILYLNNVGTISNTAICENTNYSLTVPIASDIIANVVSYQWEVSDGTTWGSVVNGGGISGATTQTLNFTSIPFTQDGKKYRCRVIFNVSANNDNDGSINQGVATICPRTSAEVTLNVRQLPPVPTINTISPQTRCLGESVTLNSTGCAGMGGTTSWYENGVVVSSNAIYTFTPSAVSSKTYKAVCTKNGCESAFSSGVVVNVNPVPVAPPVTINPASAVVCQGNAVALTMAKELTTNKVRWYNQAVAGTSVSSSLATTTSSHTYNIPVDNIVPANATTPGFLNYWVEQENTFGCKSNRTQTSFTVNPTPSAPTVTSPVNYCQNVTTNNLVATAIGSNDLLWYGTSATGGVSSAITPIPTSTNLGTTIYYVSQKNSYACESARASISVVINAIPDAPSATTAVAYCKNSTASVLSATSAGLNSLIWYDENDNILGAAPTPNTTTVGTQIFKVSQKSPAPANCESPKTTITVTINDLPLSPTVTTPVGYCQNATATALSANATGSNALLWYGTSVIGGTSSGTAPTPITTSAGTTSYYVSQKDANNCESLRAKIDVEVTPSVSATITGTNAFCITGVLNNSTTLTTNPTGGNGIYTYQWQNLAGNIASATSQTFEANSTIQTGNSDTYKVMVMSGNCTATATITVTKQGWNDVPNVSVSPIGDICGSSTKTLNIDSPSAFGTYKWFADATILTQLATGTSFSTPTLSSTTTYYVAREQQVTASLTCQTARRATTINANTIPETPMIVNSANKVIFCNNESSFSLSASCTSGNGQYRLNNGSWTNGNSVTITPSSYSSVSTLNYDFKCLLSASCESAVSSTNIIINPVPNAPIISGNTTICAGGSTTLTANGCTGTVVWSNSTSATSIIVSSAGTYNATCTTHNCVSAASATQTIVVNPIPSAPIIVSDDIDNIVCAGTIVKLSVSNCGGTVVWSNGASATSISVSSSGTYNATCIVNTCASDASSVQNIVVNQNPTILFGTINSICNTATTFELPYTATTNSPDKYSLVSTMSDFVVVTETNLLASPIAVTIPSSKTGTHSFSLTIKNSTTSCINSQDFTLTVLPVLLGGSIEVSSNTINCAGYNPGEISNVSLASGGKLNYVYQWQFSTDNVNFANVLGANLTLYNPPSSINQTTYYRRKVTDACGAEAFSSNVHQVQIVADPQITLIDASERVICSGESISLAASVIGGSGTCVATWQSSNTLSGTYTNEQVGGLNFTQILTNTSSTPLIKYYRVLYNCSGTGSSACGQSITTPIKVTVNYVPNAPVVSGNITICAGSSATLIASGCAGTVTWSNLSMGSTSSVSLAGTYSATCTENSCTSLSSNIHNLTVNEIPNIPTVASDDTDNVVCAGASIKLSVSDCAGTVVWSNATSGTSISVSTSGTYNAICMVNNCVSVPSITQTIVVSPILNPPTITGNVNICAGSLTTLTAIGCEGNITWNTGATGTTLSVSSAGTYNATCTVNDCISAGSSIQTVTVNQIPAPPTISGNTSICTGISTILTANGCLGIIRWNSGVTGSTLSVSSAGTYIATCTENSCESLASSVYTITENALPTITLSSINSVCNSATSFDLAYTATTNNPNKYSLTSTMPDFVAVGETNLLASPISVTMPSGKIGTHSFTLTMKISSTGCSNSQTFNVTVLPVLVGGSIETSSSTINCSGYNAGSISSVNLASGGKDTYGYQWQSSTNGVDFTDISGANLSTYDPPALSETTYYRRKVSDACGAEAISSNINQIQIVPDPQITITDVTDRTICSGDNISLEATVIGGSGTCTPTWQSSNTQSGTYTNEQVGGLSFTATLTNATSSAIIKYYRVAYACSGTGSGSCNQSTSSVVRITINPIPSGPIITPASVIICPTQSTTLTASGCNGLITWNSGQTGSTLSVSGEGTFAATCTLNNCVSAASATANVSVASGGIPVAPPVISGTATICSGQFTTLIATNCSGSVAWSDGKMGTSISVNPSISTDYTATCFDGTCTSNNSNKITITVNSYPTITTQPKNEADCNGNSVTFSVTASSVTSYQWQMKVPTGTFTDIANANSNSLTITNVGSVTDPNQTEYRVVLSNQNCSVTSTVAVLTVNSVVGSLADQTICDRENVSFNLSTISISGNIQSYQWQRRVGTSGIWNDIEEATSTILTINTAISVDEQYYRCKVNFSSGNSTTCARYTTEDDSNGAKLNILAASNPSITGANAICLGRSTTLTVNNCNGIITWSSGQSTATISVSPTNNTSYTVSCTSTQCGFNVSSVPFLVTVNSTAQPEIITYDVITPATLTFAARTTVPNATLMWYNRASGGTGTTTAPSFSSVGTYSYWVTQTDPITGCESVRLPIIAKVLDYFRITQQPTNQVDCNGNSVFFGVVAVGPNTAFTYQWQRKRPNEPDFVNLVEDENGIRGWYAQVMTISNVGDANNPNQTQYRCIIGNNGEFLTSEISTLTVNSLVGSMPNLGICIGATNELNLQNYFTITGNVMSYQWQTRPGTSGAWANLNDGNGIVGSSTSVLKFTKATYEQGVYYRCLVKFNTQGFECTESTDAAKLIVSGFPPAPLVSSVFYCQHSNAVRLKVDSPIQNLVWYTQEIGGTGITTPPTPNTSTAGIFKYYVSDRTDEGCESPRAVINVEVGVLPPAPKNTTLSPVSEGNTLTFAAEGNPSANQVLRWYTSPTAPIFSTTTPIFTAAGTYTRYVAQVSVFGCVSQRTAITATIIPSLKFTRQPASQADCDGNSVTFSVTATAPSTFTYQWQYKKPNETSFVDLVNETSNSLKVNNIGGIENPNSTRYRCVIKDDKNTTISEEAVLTVNHIEGKLATMSLCDGNPSKLSFSNLTITGSVVAYQWQKKVGSTYTDIPTNANGVATINEIGTYRGRISFFVDKTITCNRLTEDIKVEPKPNPVAPQVMNQYVCQNTEFDIIKAVSTTNSLLWYESTTDTTADKIAPKVDVSKLNKITYYVSQITPFGCESERKSFNVEVVTIPEKPITSNLAYCRNAPSFVLTATASPQNKILWYASLTAKDSFIQTPIPDTKTDGETIYFAATKNLAGCESERVPLKVSIAPCIATFENNFDNCLQILADSVKGNKWFDLHDNSGRIYASVNPNGLNLGNVSISIRHYGRGSVAIPTTQNGTKLMARYVDMQSSLLNKFPTDVSLRIYYSNEELNEYKTSANLPNLTINDFNIMHYDGIREDCSFENNDNFFEGNSYVIYKNIIGNQINKDFFYLQFDVNEFSENGATANDFTEISFSGKETEAQNVQLNWQSKYEIKAEKFILERSEDCKNFTKISEIKANGTASVYESVDYQPFAGESCYRLVYIDKDGTKKYLDAIKVNFTDENPICSIFPNPWIEGDEIKIYLRNIKEKTTKLYDMSGKDFSFNLSKDESKIIKLRPDTHLSKGIYFVVILGEDDKKCVQKIVINP